MKTKYFIFESLLFIACIFLFFSNKEGDGKNYRVKTVNRIAQTSSALHAASPFTIRNHIACPDGSIGCGDGPGTACGSGETDCKSPLGGYHQVTCPSDISARGCQLIASSTPSCLEAKNCPTPPANPTKHPLPCEYGNPAMGCFTGWSSGPYCTVLVNCLPPPVK